MQFLVYDINKAAVLNGKLWPTTDSDLLAKCTLSLNGFISRAEQSGAPMPEAYVDFPLEAVEREPGLPMASAGAKLRVRLMERKIQPPAQAPAPSSASAAQAQTQAAPRQAPYPQARPSSQQHQQQGLQFGMTPEERKAQEWK